MNCAGCVHHRICVMWRNNESQDASCFTDSCKETLSDIIGINCDFFRLRELVKADRDGRCIILPKDGMLYYLEEAIDGSEKWIGNKPIVDVYFKVGWGIATLSYSIFDIGKKVFFDRKSAEIALEELLKGE